MQITVIGTTATIKSTKIKLADLTSEGTSLTSEGKTIYTVRKGSAWNNNTASFNNADAEGFALYQFALSPVATPEEVKAELVASADMYNAFAKYEDDLANLIAANKAAKNAFAESIIMA